MKLILLFCLVFLCTLIGLGVSKNYKERKRFFEELLTFVQFLKTDIVFGMTKLQKSINTFSQDVKNSNLKSLLNNYCNILKDDGIINQNRLFENIKILKNDEIDLLLNFFKGLGKSDVMGQVEHFEKMYKRIEIYFNQSKNEKEKYGNLYTKIGFLIGLFLCLIFI